MNGQSLDTVSRVSRRIWSATMSRGVGEPTDAVWASALSTVVSAVSTTSLFNCTRSATRSPAHTCQSLPEPQELGGNSTDAPTNPSATASDSVPTRTPASGQRAQHPLQPHRPLVPPVAEQLGVEGRDHVGGPADALAFADEPLPHHLDEVVDVHVDGAVGALRVVGRLGIRGHIAAGDARRLEAGEVVVGVEVAVGGVAGIAGLRRPHPVADLQVAAERDDIESATGRPSAVSPCSDGPSTMKWPTPAAA